MKRWTICGKANMAKRPLKNLDDGFTVYLYTIPSTFYFQIFVNKHGGKC